jgi:hypothetical protein
MSRSLRQVCLVPSEGKQTQTRTPIKRSSNEDHQARDADEPKNLISMPTRKKTQLGDSDMEHTGDAASSGLVRPTKRNTENIDAPTTDFSGIPYFTATSTFLQNNGIFIYTKGLEDTFLSANHSTLAHNSRLYYETNVLHTPLVDKNADDAKMDTKSKRQRNRESGKHNLVDRVDDLN